MLWAPFIQGLPFVKDAAEEGAQFNDYKPKVTQSHGNTGFSFLFYLKTRDDRRVMV